MTCMVCWEGCRGEEELWQVNDFEHSEAGDRGEAAFKASPSRVGRSCWWLLRVSGWME